MRGGSSWKSWGWWDQGAGRGWAKSKSDGADGSRLMAAQTRCVRTEARMGWGREWTWEEVGFRLSHPRNWNRDVRLGKQALDTSALEVWGHVQTPGRTGLGVPHGIWAPSSTKTWTYTAPLLVFSRWEAQACLLEGSEAALQQEHKLSNGGLWAPSDRI